MSSLPGTGFIENTIAVIVLYGKTTGQSVALQSLSRCMKRTAGSMDILIYDNTLLPPNPPDPVPDKPHVFYVHDPSNSGVSRAYNRGFRMARQMGKKWLFLLDQDTELPPQALERYSSALFSNRSAVLFAPTLTCRNKVFSPCGYVSHVGFSLADVRPGVCSIAGKSLLNSGMFISVDAFEKVGGFDERIPLDFADHDFIKRYKKHFDTFVLVDVVCQHGFSGNEPADIDKSLLRFGYYCRGARNCAKSIGDTLSLFPVAFARSVRLSLRYKSFRFLQVLFRASKGD